MYYKYLVIDSDCVHGAMCQRHQSTKYLYRHNPRSVYALYTGLRLMICMLANMYRMIVYIKDECYIHSMSQHLQIPILSKVKAPRKKPNPKTFAQCRISIPEYESALYVAQQAFAQGQIKAPTVSALTKACLITMLNSYSMALRYQQEVIDAEKKRRELQAIAPSRISQYPNIPNLKF
jgi:hypothetical protein